MPRPRGLVGSTGLSKTLYLLPRASTFESSALKLAKNGLVGSIGRSQLSTTRKYGRPDTMNPNSFCFLQVRLRFVSVGFVCEKCANSARPHSTFSGRCPADCR